MLRGGCCGPTKVTIRCHQPVQVALRRDLRQAERVFVHRLLVKSALRGDDGALLTHVGRPLALTQQGRRHLTAIFLLRIGCLCAEDTAYIS